MKTSKELSDRIIANLKNNKKMRKNSVKRIYKRLYLLTRKTDDIKLYYQVSTLLKFIKTPKIICYKQLTMFNNEN